MNIYCYIPPGRDFPTGPAYMHIHTQNKCTKVQNNLTFFYFRWYLWLRSEPTKPPMKVKVEFINKTKVVVSWKPIPCSHQNGAILNYLVTYSYSLLAWEVEKQSVTEGRFLQVALPNLRPNTKYTLKVAGVNSEGAGPFSSPWTFVTFASKDHEVHTTPSNKKYLLFITAPTFSLTK